MRPFALFCALAWVGCGDEDEPAWVTVDRSLLDAGARQTKFDSGTYTGVAPDGALAPPCPTIAVCVDGEPGLLYNVCIGGTASGVLSAPACLVDPNGRLYLAPLTEGQVVQREGWTLSTDATLSADDQVRCDAARAALLVDAATPKCAML